MFIIGLIENIRKVFQKVPVIKDLILAKPKETEQYKQKFFDLVNIYQKEKGLSAKKAMKKVAEIYATPIIEWSDDDFDLISGYYD